MTQNILATAKRDENWWAIEFHTQGREFSTQAKTLASVPAVVQDACQLLGLGPVNVKVVSVTPYDDLVQSYKTAAQQAVTAKAKVGVAARKAARKLRAEGLSLRDIAEVLGITPARVGQLLN